MCSVDLSQTPLVAQLTTRQYSVFLQLLASTLYGSDNPVMQLIHILCFYKPSEDKIHRSQFWSTCPPLLIHWSGNSLSRKAWTWQVKWGGAPSNWKIVLIGTWWKAVFSITARKVSPVTHCRFFKNERTDNFVLHQSAPHIDLWWIMLMFSTNMRIFTSPWQSYLLAVPHTWNVALSENTVCQGRSNCSHVPRRWPWPSRKKTERVTTPNGLTHTLMSAFIF
jgi:hypothetical protein